ncbi:coiled-coil domain-containing protein [Olsenella massiliensis]|uniref:hypothetical protein n=1 Tax=Olsenella massiliensis TaxID=1622075 RepID=UPI00071D5627|nr:hypothetical protein [Olsenella massiliensis]
MSMQPQETSSDERPDEGAGQDASALSPLKGGLDAVKRVWEASRQHATARGQLRELSQALKEDRDELERRTRIEDNYDAIVSEQEAELKDAQGALRDADGRAEKAAGDAGALQESLSSLRAEHEDSLRPYRELMDATKGRSDDAARSLADARRAVKGADQQVAEAAKRREQRIAAANKAVDNAQDRLRKVQAELMALKKDPSASASALSKMQSEAVAEQAHLDAARNDVARVTVECQQLVDNAQTHLWTQRQSLEAVERQAGDAKREATSRREEYESLYNAARDEERQLQDQISQVEHDRQLAQDDAREAQGRITAARDILDEAGDVHDTPEKTAALERAIDERQAQLVSLEAEVEGLARFERNLRARTRGQRLAFVGIALLALAAVVAVVVIVTQVLR